MIFMARKSQAQIAADQREMFAAMIAESNAALLAALQGGNVTQPATLPAKPESKGQRGNRSQPEVKSKAVPVSTPLTVSDIAHYDELTQDSERNGRKFSARYAAPPKLVQSHLLGTDGKDRNLIRLSVVKPVGYGDSRKQVAQGDVTYTRQQLRDLIAALSELEAKL